MTRLFCALMIVGMSTVFSSVVNGKDNDNTNIAMVEKTEKSVHIWINWRDMDPTQTKLRLYAKAPAERKEIDILHIPEEVSVVFHVQHFNWIGYSLNYKVDIKKEEPVSKAYGFLDTLWKTLLTSAGIGVMAGPGDFNNKAIKWALEIEKLNGDIDMTVTKFKNTAMSEQDEADLNSFITGSSPDNSLAAKIKSLELKRAEAFEALNASNNFLDLSIWRQLDTSHAAVLAKAGAVVRASDLVKEALHVVVEKTDAGDIVSVSLQATDNQAPNAPSQVASMEYFVESKLPLAFHIGYSISDLKDVTFEKVRALQGTSDLFARTRNSDTSKEFTAFLSLKMHSFDPLGEISLSATLGTDLEDPGEKLYVGPSFSFKKFVITGGFVNGSVADEGNKIVDQIGDLLQQRELFDNFTKRREWGPFFGVSVLLWRR